MDKNALWSFSFFKIENQFSVWTVSFMQISGFSVFKIRHDPDLRHQLIQILEGIVDLLLIDDNAVSR